MSLANYDTRQAVRMCEEVGLRVVHIQVASRRSAYDVSNKAGNCLLAKASGQELRAFSDGLAAVVRHHTDVRVVQEITP